MRDHAPPKKHDDKNRPDTREKKAEDRELDEELDDSFPASDPPSITQPVHDDDEE